VKLIAGRIPGNQEHHTIASRLCSTMMSTYFKPKMEAIIDKGTKVSHEYFST
jgi:hypothetical protein